VLEFISSLVRVVCRSRLVVSRPGESDSGTSLFKHFGLSELIRNAGNRCTDSVGTGECSPSGGVLSSNSDDNEVTGSEVVRETLEDVHVDNAFCSCLVGSSTIGSSSCEAIKVFRVVLVV
jgi:hypothetical protein